MRELRRRGREHGQPALLRYVSGLNQLTARRVYEYRREHGPFHSREQLREVPGFGEATFIQAAGFLKIAGGENPLDATWIHPECYAIATQVLERFGGKPADLTEKEAAAALAQRMTAVDLDGLAKDLGLGPVASPPASTPASETPADGALAPVPVQATASEIPAEASGLSPVTETASEIPAEAAPSTVSPLPAAPLSDPASAVPAAANVLAAASVTSPAPGSRKVPKEPSIGTLTLRDILAQLARPGRDPREDLPAPVFKQGVLKLEDLAPGMELTGTVLNVVDFGCFVDIGMHDSGLVHVSRLADRFIRDPHEVVAVGDVVKVWVMEVDKERRRVSLTMVRPGSERSRRPQRGEGGEGQQTGQDQAGQDRAGQGQGRSGGYRDRPPRGGQGRQGGRRDGQQNYPQNQQVPAGSAGATPSPEGGQARASTGRKATGRKATRRPSAGWTSAGRQTPRRKAAVCRRPTAGWRAAGGRRPRQTS